MPRGAETRKRLLMAALDLFSQRGYEAVTVKEIGDRAGIQGSSMYNHFEGKAEILDEVVKLSVEKMEECLPTPEAMERFVAEGDPEQLVMCFAYDYAPEDMELMLKLHRLQYMAYYSLPAIRELLTAERDKKAGMLSGGLRKLAERGKIPPVDYDLETACRMLVDTIMVTGLEATVEGCDLALLAKKKNAAFQSVLEIATRGMGDKNTRPAV